MFQTISALLVLLFATPLFAAVTTSEEAAQQEFEQWAAEFADSLSYQTGRIELPGGIAILDMPEGYWYIDPADAQRLLTEGWGNPPDGIDTLGMVLPEGINPLSYEGWGVVIEYAEDGYVSDDDAADIDYAEMLSDLQEATEEENTARVEAGYGAMHLVGWAEQPRYEAEAHKLYWAKELSFDGESENTLNYNVRVLGRKGMIVMNAVGGMSQLPAIRLNMQDILAFTNFNDGFRYQDFDPQVDEVAAYGIGALVAGKLAAKAGLFAKLGVLLLAMKKFLIFILIGIAALVKRLVSRTKTLPGAPE